MGNPAEGPAAGRDRGWTGRGWAQGGSSIRLSDAERAEVAEQLTQHFSEGRLDQAEFDQRLEQAMSAKTRADLAGLFDDLPPLRHDPPTAATTLPPPPLIGRRRHRPLAVLLVILATIAGANIIGRLFFWPWAFFPWVWLGIAAFLLLRLGPRRRWRRY